MQSESTAPTIRHELRGPRSTSKHLYKLAAGASSLRTGVSQTEKTMDEFDRVQQQRRRFL